MKIEFHKIWMENVITGQRLPLPTNYWFMLPSAVITLGERFKPSKVRTASSYPGAPNPSILKTEKDEIPESTFFTFAKGFTLKDNYGNPIEQKVKEDIEIDAAVLGRYFFFNPEEQFPAGWGFLSLPEQLCWQHLREINAKFK